MQSIKKRFTWQERFDDWSISQCSETEEYEPTVDCMSFEPIDTAPEGRLILTIADDLSCGELAYYFSLPNGSQAWFCADGEYVGDIDPTSEYSSRWGWLPISPVLDLQSVTHCRIGRVKPKPEYLGLGASYFASETN